MDVDRCTRDLTRLRRRTSTSSTSWISSSSPWSRWTWAGKWPDGSVKRIISCSPVWALMRTWEGFPGPPKMPLAVLCHPWSGAWLDGRLDAAAPVIGPATTNNCLGTSNLSAALTQTSIGGPGTSSFSTPSLWHILTLAEWRII